MRLLEAVADCGVGNWYILASSCCICNGVFNWMLINDLNVGLKVSIWTLSIKLLLNNILFCIPSSYLILTSYFVWYLYDINIVPYWTTRADVAQQMRTKNKDQCEKHYNKCYLINPKPPLQGEKLYVNIDTYILIQSLFLRMQHSYFY